MHRHRLSGPFSLSTSEHPLNVPGWAIDLAERIFGLAEMNHLYHTIHPSSEPQPFIQFIFDFLHIRLHVRYTDVARIPQDGAVVVVANHPFGGLEGMLLGNLLLSVRPDVKILANFLLQRIPELRDLFIFVDPFGTAQSSRANIQGVRAALRWLEAGGMLGIFPAGEVAHLSLRIGRVVEPMWGESVARLIRHSGVAVLPVAFVGSNRRLFHLAGLLHPMLRTALLPRELLNKRNQTIEMCIGDVIAPSQIETFTSDRALIDYLRRHTLGLVRERCR